MEEPDAAAVIDEHLVQAIVIEIAHQGGPAGAQSRAQFLSFGRGVVGRRGFAVVHCLGILTSLFSAVVVSRALINLIYGRRRKLESLAIGQIWKPGTNAVTAK